MATKSEKKVLYYPAPPVSLLQLDHRPSSPPPPTPPRPLESVQMKDNFACIVNVVKQVKCELNNIRTKYLVVRIRHASVGHTQRIELRSGFEDCRNQTASGRHTSAF